MACVALWRVQKSPPGAASASVVLPRVRNGRRTAQIINPLGNGAGAARVGGKTASLMSLEGFLDVLASLQEIRGKLPHLEAEDLS